MKFRFEIDSVEVLWRLLLTTEGLMRAILVPPWKLPEPCRRSGNGARGLRGECSAELNS